MLRFANGKISLNIPGIGGVEGSWEPDEREREAAWELYIELVTRISVQELAPGEGLLREALTSLYSIFTVTREILRKYGPIVGRPNRRSEMSVGSLSVAVLNYVLRPLLAKWHPLLLDYENARPQGTSAVAHESTWSRCEELRAALNDMRLRLTEYADVLAEVSQVPPMRFP